ncbi:uncharacterized protein HMPREF1541_04906 [Cyphellophora europaea CBS 101466]|uniref:Uncharacterized protein n=1 Tax=Cyphellophora europaea (strain CBS 101466) TaxID=1220924 RepID=W2RY72_CYPE1|nr:uncharacterized protein HMPREF1541_04906 [Cyphellophora europaea CBS 101466]ETN40629.1 hypothetical protein HMPREF1541_04906 [Cyphellophora europaea CBS 101466]
MPPPRNHQTHRRLTKRHTPHPPPGIEEHPNTGPKLDHLPPPSPKLNRLPFTDPVGAILGPDSLPTPNDSDLPSLLADHSNLVITNPPILARDDTNDTNTNTGTSLSSNKLIIAIGVTSLVVAACLALGIFCCVRKCRNKKKRRQQYYWGNMDRHLGGKGRR